MLLLPSSIKDTDTYGPQSPPIDRSKYLSFQPLPSDKEIDILSKYKLSSKQVTETGIKWSPTIERYIIPIRSRLSRPIGFVARSENPKIKPKSITYVTVPDSPLGSYFINDPNSRLLWVVEDQYSALRLSEWHNAVALLGTNLSISLLADIKAGKFTDLVICLDADAADKGAKICEEISGMFNHISLRVPKEDIKNMTFFGLKRFLSE